MLRGYHVCEGTRDTLRINLNAALTERTISETEALADYLARPLSVNDVVAVRQMLSKTTERNADILYILVRYLDEGERVMGDSTMDVIKWYEQEGLARSDDCKDLPDHIAIELEFVSFLACKEIEALETAGTHAATEYAAKQQSFTRSFLCPWVPAFCEKIKQGTDNDYYVALAGCVATVIKRDLDVRNNAQDSPPERESAGV